MQGEHYEHVTMYPSFAKIAREEGFEDIARQFEMVAEIEKMHEQEYKHALDMLSNGQILSKDNQIEWRCEKCGHVHYSTEPPSVCPVCSHSKEYFRPSKT